MPEAASAASGPPSRIAPGRPDPEGPGRARAVPLFPIAAGAVATASLAFHASVRYLDSTPGQVAGTLFWATALVIAFAYTVAAPRRSELSWRSLLRETGWAGGALLLAGCLFHLVEIRSFGLWLDEVYFIEQAREILAGRIIHPAGFIGDAPANFEAWPVAGLLALTHDPKLAVRLPGVLYLLAAAALAGRLAHHLLGRRSAAFALLFATFSLWSVHQGFMAWHNVTITPVLVLWQLCLFVEARVHGCERSLRWLAIGLGVAFTLLYVPLFLVALLAPFAALDFRRFPLRALAGFVLVFLLVAGPTLGKCVQYTELSLGRHANYLRGGEQPTTPPSVGRYAESLKEIVDELKADSLREPTKVARFGLWPTYLEVTTLWCLWAGLAAVAVLAWRRNVAARWTLAATAWTLLALVLTNPGTSCWRQAGLVPLLWVIAAAGAAAIVAGPARLGAPVRVPAGVAAVLVAAHVAVFARLYWRYQDAQFRNPAFTHELVADRIQPFVVAFAERGYLVALPVPLAAPLVKAATYRALAIFEYRSAEEALQEVSPGKPFALGILADQQDAAAQQQTMATVRAAVPSVKELTVRGSDGTLIATFLHTPLPDGDVLGRPAPAPRPSPGAAAAAPPPSPRLTEPRGVALTASGHVLACDFGNHRIAEFGADLSLVRSWGRLGKEPGELTNPCAVAVGPGGTVFVVDTWNHRGQSFSPAGASLGIFTDDFFGPRGIAVDAQGAVFIADTGHDRVVRFGPDGRKQLAWGSTGTGSGQLQGPMGLAIDRTGRVLVADNDNGRLQAFSRDGVPVTSFAVPGWRRAPCSEPHVAVDAHGRIWVTVPAEGEVRAYDEKGALLATLAASSTPGTAFEVPAGIAVDPARSELVISDMSAGLVRLPLPAPGTPKR